jgi:pilus assembly protein CpaB
MKRRIGLVALAAILALAGTLAVYTYARNADKRAVEKTRSTGVLYAARLVPAGTTWKQVKDGHYLTEEQVPAGAAPRTAIGRIDASIPDDQVSTADIAAGQIAVREMFGEKQPQTGVLAIPRTLQAVTVALPANADVAGYVKSGSQVAIYLTSRLEGGSKNKVPDGVFGGQNDDPKIFATKLLLARVDVLATSENPPSNLDGVKRNSTSNNSNQDTVLVTLAVDQKSAERLILGQTTGQLYLALLSSNSITAPDGGIVNVGIFKPTPIFAPGQ